MAYGMAAREIFGDEVVSKYAAVAASNANRHLASGDLLAAAFSAAHFVRLTGRQSWAEADQERMANELRESAGLQAQAGDGVTAAARAASYHMLTEELPWSEEELEDLRKNLAAPPDQRHAYNSMVVAERLAHYLLLGGAIFWTVDEFHEMRTAVITDFGACVERKEEILAADRLAIFDVLEANLEAARATT